MTMKKLEQYCKDHNWRLFTNGPWPHDHWMRKLDPSLDWNLVVKKNNQRISKKFEMCMNVNKLIKKMKEYDSLRKGQSWQIFFNFMSYDNLF